MTTANRPLATFALFAYNQEKYIREAVEGAFAQTYEPLEIILSDDCSSDRTFEIIQEMAARYEGPHSLVIRQNDCNYGLAAHVNAVLGSCRGEIAVIAAGDDISLPDRTRLSVTALSNDPMASAVLLSGNVINERGELVGEKKMSARISGSNDSQDIEDLLSWQHVTFGASRAIRLDVFRRFGPLDKDCPTEDTPMLVRSLMLGRNVLLADTAIHYRRHSSNLSSENSLRKMKTDEIYKQYERDIRHAFELKIIDGMMIDRLLLWLNIDRRARLIKIGHTNAPGQLISDARFIIYHDAFRGVNRKLLLMKVLLRGIFPAKNVCGL